MQIICIVLVACVLDLILGDPHYAWHPACLMGNLIAFLEKRIRKQTDTDKSELAGGALLALLVVLISTLVPALILIIAYRLWFPIGFILESIMCYQLLAARSLRDESMKVYDALVKKDVEGARYAVSMIVGRDTSVLDTSGITRAAVETVAENASDGVIAPLIFMLIGGAPLAFFYKAVNTMDSMIGYKNDRYLYFGRTAAKLDDILNFMPSRISGVLMVLAAGLTGLDMGNAWKIFLRDRKKHASPNSAQTESACAGALGLRLAGDAQYFGKVHHKPFIGDALREIEPDDIRKANRLMYAAGLLCLICGIVIRAGLFVLIL